MGFSQDFKQKIKSSLIFIKEMYRVVVGSFYLSTVPHGLIEYKIKDNLTQFNGLTTIGSCSNVFTFLFIFLLYCVEMKRELKLISYLDVNNNLARDNDSVGKRLELLSVSRREALWKWDRIYQKLFDGALVVFIFNTIISGKLILVDFGKSSKTYSVFLTNVMFLSSKLFSMYYVKKSKINVFYSAYLTKKVQYNDIDPDKILKSIRVRKYDRTQDIRFDDI